MSWRSELGSALRSLRRRPAFALFAALTLSLGVGLTSVLFTFVEALLLRPLAVREPAGLVNLYSSVPGGVLGHLPMSLADVRDLEREASELKGFFAYAWNPVAWQRGDSTGLVLSEIVTGSYFSTLGLVPELGRLIEESDDPPGGASPVAVLSHDTWQREFRADPAVLGHELTLNGQRFTVIGVASRDFRGLVPSFVPAFWLPMETAARLPSGVTIRLGRSTPGATRLSDRGVLWVWAGARLRPGATVESARMELAAQAASLARRHPTTNAERAFLAEPLTRARIVPEVDRIAWLASAGLLGLFSLFAALAALGLASLSLARALARQTEWATRVALGATRRQLLIQWAAESVPIAFIATVAAVGFAAAGAHLLARIDLPLEWPLDLDLAPAVDWRVVLFASALAFGTTCLFALPAAWVSTRFDAHAALRRGTVLSPPPARRSLRRFLVGTQVALATALLATAGLALESLVHAMRVDSGLSTAQVAVATFSPELVSGDSARWERHFTAIGDRLTSFPNVREVTWTSHLPLTFAINFGAVAPQRSGPLRESDWLPVDAATVGPGYFDVLGVPLLAGRALDERDSAGAPVTVVVNEALARRLAADGRAVGMRLRLAGVDEDAEVVGVASTGRYRTLGESPRPFLYRSLSQDPRGTRTLAVRFEGDPATALAAIRKAARDLAPEVPVGPVQTLTESMNRVLFLPRALGLVLAVLGVVALLLATVSVAGVVAHEARERRREIGLRWALGARRRQLVFWLVRHGVAPVAVGSAFGLLGAAWAGRTLQALLYGVDALEPIATAGASLLLLAASAVACALVGRRATRHPPAAVLRGD